ncbi:MAG: hypothetical protein AB7F99_04625 [Vicinamibacterales bacterium]
MAGAGRSRRGLSLVVLALLVWPLAGRIVEVGASQVPPARDGALRIVKAVRAAQETYRSVHGYYDRLECLVQDACVPNPYPPTYLATEDARATAHGYRFQLADGPRASAGIDDFVSPTGMTAYALTVVPTSSGLAVGESTSFCADVEGIYEYADGHLPAVTAGRCIDRGTKLH